MDMLLKQSHVMQTMLVSLARPYCQFADFAKAFDTVNCDYLVYSLVKFGMHGRVLKLT